MASRFDQSFQRSGFPQLLAEYGEPVTYLFAGGGSRSIDAIIERNPPAIFDAAGQPMLVELIIRIYRHGTLGVLSNEINRGSDSVDVLKRVDDVATSRMTVTKKLSDDSGVIVLALN
jgi:hypothetical protein